MILHLLIATSVSTAPPVALPSPDELLSGARHALRANRLDQATVMISRAVAARASGAALDRVVADLAYARGSYAEALARYKELLKLSPHDQGLLEPAVISAVKLGRLEEASGLLSVATSRAGTSWRVWSASGVVADWRRDWVKADQSYEEAVRLAPKEAGPVNNRGWSMLLRGDWKTALNLFEQAAVLDPKSERVADNLELARTALTADLPKREAGETDASWAARLNDAGVAASILGDKSRATAAFTRALDVSGTWYARAANNLEAVSRR